MTERSRQSFRRALLAGLAGLFVLALWFGGISWATDAGIRTFEAHTVVNPDRPADPQPWRAQRFFVEPDSYYWLAYARDLRASDAWRLRFTHADNAPYGREMHWAHLPIWGLMGISRGLEASGLPPALALELSGRILMPLFGWLFFSALYLLLGTRLGWRMATLATAILVTVLQWEFHTLRPDHHGFQLAFSMLMWLCLIFGGTGWVRKDPTTPGAGRLPTVQAARRWFMASGILGGLGLWLGATTFLFSLAALSAGAAATLLFLPTPANKDPMAIRPDLWRLWGFSGAITSLVFYAVEYAPHLGMRLEVNHPLYALCWLGTAECLSAMAVWRTRSLRSPRDAIPAVLGLASAALLPLLLFFGPADWFLPRSGIMLRLHAHHIVEFRTLFTTAGAQSLKVFLLTFGATVPAVLCAVVLLMRRRLPIHRQVALMPLCVAAILFTLLYVWQIRWEPFALAAAFLLTIFLLSEPSDLTDGWPAPSIWNRLPALLVALLCLHFAYSAFRIVHPLRQLFRVEKMDELWLKALLQRNLMFQLKTHAPDLPLRLVLPAEMAPAVYYFGVGDTLGSLYWENPDGLTSATDFFGDPLPGKRAREVARKRDITHAIMNNGAGDALMFYQLATGRFDQLGASQTVGGATARAGTPVPSWLHPEPELTAAANSTYYVLVPSIGQWVPLSLQLSIYRPVP